MTQLLTKSPSQFPDKISIAQSQHFMGLNGTP
jgi:hypothetical protein